MDGGPTWTDCNEAGDYVVPNVLSPRDLVFRPDNMDETVPHTGYQQTTLVDKELKYHSKRTLALPVNYIIILSSLTQETAVTTTKAIATVKIITILSLTTNISSAIFHNYCNYYYNSSQC